MRQKKWPGVVQARTFDCSLLVHRPDQPGRKWRDYPPGAARNLDVVFAALARCRTAVFAAGLAGSVLVGVSTQPASAQTAPAPAAAATRAGSPAQEYRAAVAAGDTNRAAVAVMGLWRGRLTEDRLRGLNARLKVEANDQTVAAVVIEVARLQQGGGPAPVAAPAPEPNGIKLVKWLASHYRPPQSAQQAPEVPGTAEIEAPPKEARPPARVAVKAPPRKKERAQPAENPAVAYETALLRRDASGMARAVAQLTGAPATAETVRKLNEEIGAETDETLVKAVVKAAPATKTD